MHETSLDSFDVRTTLECAGRTLHYVEGDLIGVSSGHLARLSRTRARANEM